MNQTDEKTYLDGKSNVQCHKRESEYLTIIRSALNLKARNLPAVCSEDEYDVWKYGKANVVLFAGVTKMWDVSNIPADADAVVVKKAKGKTYLLFDSPVRYHEYQKSVVILGTTVYLLFQERIDLSCENLRRRYNVSEAVCDTATAQIERTIGLYFRMDDVVDKTDEHIKGALWNYTKRMFEQKISSLFYTIEKHERLFKDDYELNSIADDNEFLYEILPPDNDGVDFMKVRYSIINMIYEFDRNRKNDERFDMKDRLLTQVVSSDAAAKEFVLCYYSMLEKRKSLWRPIVFIWQIVFAGENGKEYLKNPAYITACKNTTLSQMLDGEMKFIESYDMERKASGCLRVLYTQIGDSGIGGQRLAECATNCEQIGKALSKELRSQEACSALVEALVVVAVEHYEGRENIKPSQTSEIKGANCDE